MLGPPKFKGFSPALAKVSQRRIKGRSLPSGQEAGDPASGGGSAASEGLQSPPYSLPTGN